MTLATPAMPAMPAHFRGSGAAQTHPPHVVPDPQQVELEQARFDIDEAVNLMGMVKKCVLERKLQIFEQTHAGKACFLAVCPSDPALPSPCTCFLFADALASDAETFYRWLRHAC